jgi:hypothetical protein
VDLFIERRAIVQQNGDTDEFFTLIFVNADPVPIPFEPIWFKIAVTDAHCDVVSVSDGYQGDSEYWANEVDAGFLIAFRLRGAIAAKGARLAGVHFRCRERCTVEDDRLTYRDPFLSGDLGMLSVARLEIGATVVFPAGDRKRHVRAPGAAHCTSRTATWEFGPVVGPPYQLAACLEPATSPPAHPLLDDGQASLHELIARDSCGEPIDPQSVLAPLREAVMGRGLALPASIVALTDLGRLPVLRRHEHLQRALDDIGRGAFRRAVAAAEIPSAPAKQKEWRGRSKKYDLDTFSQVCNNAYAQWKDGAIADGGFTADYVLEVLREHDMPMHRATLGRYRAHCQARGLKMPLNIPRRPE